MFFCEYLLLKRICCIVKEKIVYNCDFVIGKVKYNKWTTSVCILLGFKRGDKYKWYKNDLQVTIDESEKCKFYFKLWEKPLKSVEKWIMKLLFVSHNHDLVNTLMNHQYNIY